MSSLQKAKKTNVVNNKFIYFQTILSFMDFIYIKHTYKVYKTLVFDFYLTVWIFSKCDIYTRFLIINYYTQSRIFIHQTKYLKKRTESNKKDEEYKNLLKKEAEFYYNLNLIRNSV